MSLVTKLLQKAKPSVDAIGLSGLITPSLDEMKRVVQTVKQEGIDLPILIGGATTSELHTAVQLDPLYPGRVFHVKDASQAAPVLKQITDPLTASVFSQKTSERYAELRDAYEKSRRKSTYFSLEEARQQALHLDWENEPISKPAMIGIQHWTDYPLEEIIPYIDWTYFFYAWDMRGSFPALLEHPDKGAEARRLYQDAQLLLQTLVQQHKWRARAVIGLFPAYSEGDDIWVEKEGKYWPFYQLRDQRKHPDGEYNLSLADFIAPKSSGRQDYIGTFVASVGQEPANLSTEARRLGDDYTALLIETLSDRLVEAFMERLFYLVRTRYWGFAANEKATPQDLIAGRYQGIRPAIGYPACPDHSEKETLFRLLEVSQRIGTTLTENYMMQPASSVSGFMLANPRARYFNITHITRDQAADYFRRKGRSVESLKQLII
jgi:5-methyltetrahydrofolate--homocysteine methyltransferase